MKLKKFGALLLTGVLAITSLTTSAFAAKREKRSADDIDFAAVLEDGFCERHGQRLPLVDGGRREGCD